MSLKDAYKKKAEAELELAQARVAEFKAKIKSFTAGTQVTYAEQVDHLEKAVDDTKHKLKELGDAGEEVGEKLKESVERTLHSLNASVHRITEKFKH